MVLFLVREHVVAWDKHASPYVDKVPRYLLEGSTRRSQKMARKRSQLLMKFSLPLISFGDAPGIFQVLKPTFISGIIFHGALNRLPTEDLPLFKREISSIGGFYYFATFNTILELHHDWCISPILIRCSFYYLVEKQKRGARMGEQRHAHQKGECFDLECSDRIVQNSREPPSRPPCLPSPTIPSLPDFFRPALSCHIKVSTSFSSPTREHIVGGTL